MGCPENVRVFINGQLFGAAGEVIGIFLQSHAGNAGNRNFL
jgi:hypothetical protein